MNKKVMLIVGIVLLLLIVGSVGYFSMKKAPANIYNGPLIRETNTPSKPTSMQGSLQSLFTQGGSQKCSYSNSNSAKGSAVNGTLEVANGKVRGDFTSSSSQMTVNGHMIVDSGYTYFWTDTSNQGFKVALNGQTTTPVPGSRGPDLNQSVTYSCQPWAGDNAVFTLPSNITFNSMTIPTIGTPNANGTPVTNGNATMCAACNNIPGGPGRIACMAQLHCQ